MSENSIAAHPNTQLTEQDIAILDFERTWVNHIGAKEEAISAQFQVSSARYYQMLNLVINKVAAVRYDPMLVSRLRRTRDNRTRTSAVPTTNHTNEELTN